MDSVSSLFSGLDALPDVQKRKMANEPSAVETQNLFAMELAQAQAKPTPLVQPVATNDTAEEAAIEAAGEDEEESAPSPKIARSWAMESADKATETQEVEVSTWDDFLDLINPLQHIPLVGTLYRQATGDTIRPEIQIAGSFIFGALTGSLAVSAVSGIASTIYEQSTGEEPTVQIAQTLLGDDIIGDPSADAGEIRLAEASASATAAQRETESLSAGAASLASASASAPPGIQQVVPAPVSVAAAASAPVSSAAARTVTSDPNKQMPLLAATGGLRVGNTIYTSPVLRSAAKVAPAAKTPARVDAQASAQIAAQAEGTPSTKTETPSLSAKMYEQAQARAAGNPLPPELVQDMMLMALDKYKTAHAIGGEASLSAVQ